MEEVRAFEDWAEAKWPDAEERKRNDWLMAGVRAHTHWGQGKQVTAQDFEDAVHEVLNIQLGGGPPPESK